MFMQCDGDGNGAGDESETCDVVSLVADIMTGDGDGWQVTRRWPTDLIALDDKLHFKAHYELDSGEPIGELWVYDPGCPQSSNTHRSHKATFFQQNVDTTDANNE